jgi:cytidylate kinase
LIVAIDGPAGSGKSTVAKAVAMRLGLQYLDTGAMYRTIALLALEEGLDLEDDAVLGQLARSTEISFDHEDGQPLPTRVVADGRDVTAAIRTPEVDASVSAAARAPSVREAMVAAQRVIGHRGNLVAEGRDIGTVVFPDAELKIYLTATPQERARRRHLERVERGEDVQETDVLEGIIARDGADSSREVSPLAAADDARLLDTTGLTIDEVVEEIAVLAESPS